MNDHKHTPHIHTHCLSLSLCLSLGVRMYVSPRVCLSVFLVVCVGVVVVATCLVHRGDRGDGNQIPEILHIGYEYGKQ